MACVKTAAGAGDRISGACPWGGTARGRDHHEDQILLVPRYLLAVLELEGTPSALDEASMVDDEIAARRVTGRARTLR